MAYNKTLKNGMKGSNGGESRTEKTEVLKKESKKTRRVQNKKVIKEQNVEYCHECGMTNVYINFHNRCIYCEND